MRNITAQLKTLIQKVIEIDVSRNLEHDYQYKNDALEALWASFMLLDDVVKPDSITDVAIANIEDAENCIQCITFYESHDDESTLDIIHSGITELVFLLKEEKAA